MKPQPEDFEYDDDRPGTVPVSRDRRVEDAVIGGALAKQGPALKIMIVDDNADAAATLGIMAEVLGYETQTAYGGRMAMDQASAFLPDVVLMDIGMPGMNGYELCQTLKNTPSFRHTVFIAQTGWDESSARALSEEAGFDHYLTKPVGFREVECLLGTIALKKGRPV